MTTTASNAPNAGDALTNRPSQALAIDLFMEALRVKDERLNAIASELLTRFGEEPVDRLILAAAYPKNRPAHRVRLLQVAERIAANWDPGTLDTVMALVSDQNEDVRTAAVRLIDVARQRRGEVPKRGPAGSDQDQATPK